MKKFTAILLALVLTLSFAACSGADTDETTIAETTTITDETLDFAAEPTDLTTELSTVSSENDTTVGASSVVPVTDENNSPIVTTTAATVNIKLPTGKAEILAAYTAVVNKVKVDMPEYTSNDWQEVSNVIMDKTTYNILSAATKDSLETKAESTPDIKAAGTHATWFAMPTYEEGGKVGCVLKDTSKIESANCVKSGDNFIITITLIEEKDPSRDMDNPSSVSSWHGKMFDVTDIPQIIKYAKLIPGINADNAYCISHGTATLKYNPVTNECVTLDHIIDVRVFFGKNSARVMADYHFYDFKW